MEFTDTRNEMPINSEEWQYLVKVCKFGHNGIEKGYTPFYEVLRFNNDQWEKRPDIDYEKETDQYHYVIEWMQLPEL